MPYTLIIAEKPSVGRDIARVLRVSERQEGYLRGSEYCITWAIGHLVSLSDPEEIDPRFKRWRKEDLPLLPDHIPLKVLPKTKKQFSIVRGLMNHADCEKIICATDAGREGELIFRYIYLKSGCAKPFARLWISSMTDAAIREGFARIKPGESYDLLYESARCRSEADWLVGMNASRAYTLRYGALLSIGRVQTPTLALLVRRHHEIESFESRDYWTLTGDFSDYTGLWINEETREKRVFTEEDAKRIASNVRGKPATIESVQREVKREFPPYLYDLTSLQRDANRLLSMTAKKTLEVAQKLYEERKLLTYPRTDSRHLPRDMAAKTRAAIVGLPEDYEKLRSPLLVNSALPMTSRIFDDAKVTDHHAILPTEKRANLSSLPEEERMLYDLVVRRLLAAFYPEYRYSAVRVLTRSEGEAFESLGREVQEVGWKAVYEGMDTPASKRRKRKTDAEDAQTLPQLSEGETRTVQKVTIKAEKTKPPSPHTDASLLSAMERAGRELEDEALRESMKNNGLGTPATRAAVIERLLHVGYAQRRGRSIVATDKGVRLIAVVPEAIASPETTGRWEKALSDIVTGDMVPDRFIAGIRRLSASLVDSVALAPKDVEFEREEPKKKRGGGKKAESFGTCPLCGKGDVLENSRAFYCANWRDGCALKLWKDNLVKMGGPELTGALVRLVLTEGRVVGSTGVLQHEKGIIRFTPRNIPSPPQST